MQVETKLMPTVKYKKRFYTNDLTSAPHYCSMFMLCCECPQVNDSSVFLLHNVKWLGPWIKSNKVIIWTRMFIVFCQVMFLPRSLTNGDSCGFVGIQLSALVGCCLSSKLNMRVILLREATVRSVWINNTVVCTRCLYTLYLHQTSIPQKHSHRDQQTQT